MLKISEKIFVIAMLFYTSGAVLPFFFGSQNRYSRLEGNMLELALQFAFYAVASFFMAIHWRTVMHGALQVKWIIVLLVMAMASTAWSQAPLFTLRRSMVLVATTAFGVYFGSRFPVTQQLRLLAWTCALVVLASFAIAIVFPGHGIDHYVHPGDWQGAFIQKNSLARAMVLSVFVFFFDRPSRRRPLRWAGIVAAFALLLLSHSVTGALVFVAIVVTLPIYRLLRTGITFAFPIVIALILGGAGAVVMLASSVTEILQVLNRDSNLSGRTDLWNAVIMAILKRQWLGYGFNAFWQGMQGESASVLLAIRWPALHSHNGFLDLTLDLGMVGLLAFAIGYCVLWWRAISVTKKMPGAVPVWLCTYLVFMFLYNLTESSILVQNSIFWVLYTSTAVSLFQIVPAVTRVAAPETAPAEIVPSYGD